MFRKLKPGVRVRVTARNRMPGYRAGRSAHSVFRPRDRTRRMTTAEAAPMRRARDPS
jgi:hypothetical protein